MLTTTWLPEQNQGYDPKQKEEKSKTGINGTVSIPEQNQGWEPPAEG